MGEACFCTSTPLSSSCDAHHRLAKLLSTCSFPARLGTFLAKDSSARLVFCSAHKTHNNVGPAPPAGLRKRRKSKVEDDPWETLFQQLEKDLENDTSDSDEEEITEEDVEGFEKELDMLVEDLANASTDNSKPNELGDVSRAHYRGNVKDGDDHVLTADGKKGSDMKQNNKCYCDKDLVKAKENIGDYDGESDFELDGYDEEDFSDDDFEEPRTVPLQKWQLRKLAAAFELGRRKVNIKSLAAELKLDRDDVIYFLKSPPPELLMAVSEIEGYENEDSESDLDPDEVDADSEKVNDSVVDISSIDKGTDMDEAKGKAKQTHGPRDWYKGKRIKKANTMTLQRVYKRSRWPSNAMIEGLVQATHLPRARILEWFEEERAKLGVQSPPKQSRASQKIWKRRVTHSFERLQ